MRKLLLIPIGLLLAGIVIALALPLLIDSNRIKPTLIAQLQERTGYVVSVDGKLEVHFFPTASLRAENVSISSPLVGAKPFAKAAALEIGVQTLPLARGEVEITSVLLEKPDIALVAGPAGNNWEARKTPAPGDPKERAEANRRLSQRQEELRKEYMNKNLTDEQLRAAREDARQNAPAGTGMPQISIHKIEIRDGSFSYSNPQDKKTTTLSGVNARASMASPDSPASLKASATLNGHSVTVGAEIARLDTDAARKEVPLEFSLKSDVLDTAFKGSVQNGEYKGAFSASSPSLAKLAGMFSGASPKDAADLPARIEATVNCSRSACEFSKSNVTLDGNVMTGDLSFKTGGSVPYISARFDAEKIDLSRFLEKKSAGLSLLRDAYADAPRFSNAPIDFSWARALDLALILKTGQLAAGAFSAGDVQVSSKLSGGTLSAEFSAGRLYDGKGTLNVSRADDGRIDLSSKLEAVQMEPLLGAINGSSAFSGAANISTTLRASGSSVQQYVSSLGGNGSVAITDGSYKGVDLSALMQKVVGVAPVSHTSSGKTDFSELSASFTAEGGIFNNNDLKAVTKRATITGSGSINLPAYSINYRLTPQVNTAKGEGLSVPVIVSGPLDNPTYTPDAASLVEEAIRDPEKLKEKVKNSRGAIKDLLKNSKGFLKKI